MQEGDCSSQSILTTKQLCAWNHNHLSFSSEIDQQSPSTWERNSVGRVLALQARSRKFESYRSHQESSTTPGAFANPRPSTHTTGPRASVSLKHPNQSGVVIMLTFYDSGEEFREACQVPWVQKEEVAKGFFEVNIENFGKSPNDFAVMYTKDNQTILAIRQGDNPMFFKGAESIIPDFAKALSKYVVAVKGVMAEKRAYELFIKSWPFKETRRVDMRCMTYSAASSSKPVGAVKAEKRHLKDIVELYSHFYLETQQDGKLGNLKEVAKSRLDGTYVVEMDGKAVAMAYKTRETDLSACISGVVTHPNYRGKGACKSLLQYMATSIVNTGRYCYLFVAEDNDLMRSLCSQSGFSTLKFYVHGRING